MHLNFKAAFFAGIFLALFGIFVALTSGWKSGIGAIAMGIIFAVLGIVNKSKWKKFNSRKD